MLNNLKSLLITTTKATLSIGVAKVVHDNSRKQNAVKNGIIAGTGTYVGLSILEADYEARKFKRQCQQNLGSFVGTVLDELSNI